MFILYSPLKAQFITWRLVLERLPMKENLSKRFDLGPKEKLCCCCMRNLESTVHFSFLVHQLWCKIAGWIGVHWAPAGTPKVHFMHFSGLLGGGKHRKRLGGLWICVVWILRKWRNLVLFNHKDWDFKRIKKEVKCRYWSWCLIRNDVASNLNFIDSSKNLLSYNWMIS